MKNKNKKCTYRDQFPVINEISSYFIVYEISILQINFWYGCIKKCGNFSYIGNLIISNKQILINSQQLLLTYKFII